MNRLPPLVVIHSFGFKYRPAPPAHYMLDARWIRNPFKTAELRDLSGLDQPVQHYVLTFQDAQKWATRTAREIGKDVARYRRLPGPHFVKLVVGCAGGHDRSVAIAEWMSKRISLLYNVDTYVRHLDIHHRGRTDKGIGVPA
ncbi:RapZ C-terminal domain-containing protein [Amycolatopsis anabasis]|uniref:RapZ C-terminal domain-containing protein n=1 Tax=Amycolatopsis anabasis TaxID=1840409 RepID=UPI00131B5D46|nr:RNase adapter RapZ [Amycolatopsis anabasis]